MADGGARRLEGAPIADEIRTAVAEDVASFTAANGRPPVLAVVIVGRDAPSTVYLERILKGCAKVGIEAAFVELEGEDAIKRFSLANAPAYAHPRFVWFVEELPLASTNKVDRAALHRLAEERITGSR